MKVSTFTAAVISGLLLLASPPLMAQATSTDSVKTTEEIDLETAKREYHRKVLQRNQAQKKAKEANAAAKEAKYQELEALEAAKTAERAIRLEERAHRREEKRANRKPKSSEASSQ